MIPYGRHTINQADIDAVSEVLRSDFLTQGQAVPAFEKALTDFTGAKYAVAVNSATSALHIACLSLGIGKGDLVWTSPITFVASANCALYCGAEVDFVDIDPSTFNLSITQLVNKLEAAKASGRLPKLVIAVHLCGQPCDMAAIWDLSKRYGFKVIEDASHAIGASYSEKRTGDCSFSDITIFSFHPVKIVTTAEGGAALTNSKELARHMELLRSHGITRDPSEMTHAPDGPWYYQQIELGFNYRMTDLQAALGISQMKRLNHFIEIRRKLAETYDSKLSGLPLSPQQQPKNSVSAYHLYVVRLHLNEIKKSHKVVFEELRQKGIGVNLHYIPVHMQPFYQRLKKQEKFLEAEKYYQEAISLPIFPELSIEQQEKVVQTLKEVLQK